MCVGWLVGQLHLLGIGSVREEGIIHCPNFNFYLFIIIVDIMKVEENDKKSSINYFFIIIFEFDNLAKIIIGIFI